MRASVLPASQRKKDIALTDHNSPLRQILWPALVIISIVVLDQATKIWAVNNLVEGQPVEVLGRFFMFTLLYNEGGAMGTVLGTPTYYLVSSLVILSIILVYMYLNRRQTGLAIALAAIAGGAIGNIIDRVRIGRVVDFLDFDFFDISLFGYTLDRFWTFNIADSAITCSIVYLLVHALFFARPHAHDASEDDNQSSDSGTTVESDERRD